MNWVFEISQFRSISVNILYAVLLLIQGNLLRRVYWLRALIRVMELQAVRRRFDKRIYIPLPDFKARQHMFKVLILLDGRKLLACLNDVSHNYMNVQFQL